MKYLWISMWAVYLTKENYQNCCYLKDTAYSHFIYDVHVKKLGKYVHISNKYEVSMGKRPVHRWQWQWRRQRRTMDKASLYVLCSIYAKKCNTWDQDQVKYFFSRHNTKSDYASFKHFPVEAHGMAWSSRFWDIVSVTWKVHYTLHNLFNLWTFSVVPTIN